MSYPHLGYTPYPPPLAARQLLLAGGHQGSTSAASSSEPKVPEGLAVPPFSAANLLNMSRFPGLPENLLQATAAAQAYLQNLADQSMLYSARNASPEGKEGSELWRQFMPYFSFDPVAAHSTYPYLPPNYAGFDLHGARRKNATRETTSLLKKWLYENRKNPYPTKGEKVMLAVSTQMSLTQVSTWFANARRRLKKENKMTWSPRNRSGDSTCSKSDGEECGEDKEDDNMSLDLSDFGESARKSEVTDIDRISPGLPRVKTEVMPDSMVRSPHHLDSKDLDIHRQISSSTLASEDGNRSPSSPGTKAKIWSIADVVTKSPSNHIDTRPSSTLRPPKSSTSRADSIIKSSLSTESFHRSPASSPEWGDQKEALSLTTKPQSSEGNRSPSSTASD